jgi:membrane associated rhomboid family serine protease
MRVIRRTSVIDDGGLTLTSRDTRDAGSVETLEPPGISLEAYRRKSRKDAVTATLWGSGLVLLHLVLLFVGTISFSDLFHSLLFIIGVVGLAGGAWEFYRAGRLTPEDLSKLQEAQDFARAVDETALTYTKAILACLIVVAVVQLLAGDEESIRAAGLVKDAVRGGELWRVATCATLHVNFIHIWMNGQALLGFGRLLESLTDRAYLPLVFLPSAACGSVFSLVLMPDTTSVGASGGLMGLVGFLAVLGYRRKEILPAGFFKSVLLNICFIGVIGLVGFALIDNAAHLGGLLAGVVCGVLLISKSGGTDVAAAGRLVRGLGFVTLLAIALISLLSIIMILSFEP